VLSTVAVTAVMVAYADRLHSEFRDAGLQRMAELEREFQARSK